MGTPPHETREVKATEEGRIVQSKIEAMIPMKMMALRGCPFLSTLPIHDDPGRIPSRAMAKTSREAAVIARLVFCEKDCEISRDSKGYTDLTIRLTMKRPTMATILMTIPPPLPIADA